MSQNFTVNANSINRQNNSINSETHDDFKIKYSIKNFLLIVQLNYIIIAMCALTCIEILENYIEFDKGMIIFISTQAAYIIFKIIKILNRFKIDKDYYLKARILL